MTVLRHACAHVLVEAARGISGPCKKAVVEMGSPPTGLPAVVIRRIETGVKGVYTRTVSRSLREVPTPKEAARPLGARVTQRPENAGKKKTPEGLTTAAT